MSLTISTKPCDYTKSGRLKKEVYETVLADLQIELVKLQEWIQSEKLKVVVLFEGRDAAGKGGVIKRITECLNPRVVRIVALGKPNDRQRNEWYFKRYVAELPAAGVDRVMGFIPKEQVTEFFHSCPEFERMLIRSGTILIKYWFSVSNREQERRFQARIASPLKHWKLSDMDLISREKWVEYSKQKMKCLSIRTRLNLLGG
tara:strand:- start:1183 stop:1788 length:606 start_codon:yes stop_codon:yes gene_type:complete